MLNVTAEESEAGSYPFTPNQTRRPNQPRTTDHLSSERIPVESLSNVTLQTYDQ